MNKKGQAALEYLMTYGWALIIIAIVMGVLIFVVTDENIDEEYIISNCEHIGEIKDFSIKSGGNNSFSKVEIILKYDKKIITPMLNNLETGLDLYKCGNLNNYKYMVI